MIKIILNGTAGQGLKLLGFVLANILKDQNYYVALTFKYDALMRFGKSSAFVIVSKKKIENILIDKADFEYNLDNKKLQKNLLKKYNNLKILNMVLLGVILKRLNIKINKIILKQYLPKGNLIKNLQAIESGYKI